MLIFFFLATTIISESDFSEDLWENSFTDSEGNLEFSCVGNPRQSNEEDQVLNGFERYLRDTPNICSCVGDDPRRLDPLICSEKTIKAAEECGLLCSINCSNRRNNLECFDEAGALAVGVPKNRSCTFHLRFPFEPENDKLYPFPAREDNGHFLEHIYRSCLHLNYEHDRVDDAVAHPFYYCQSVDSCQILDCTDLTVENIIKYTSDIDHIPEKLPPDRHFICACDHPFVAGPGERNFSMCKDTVESVWKELNSFNALEKCLIVNHCNDSCAQEKNAANLSINKKLRQICGQVGGRNTFLHWITFFAISTTGLFALVTYRRCKSFGFRGCFGFRGSGGHGTDAGATEVTILVDSREEPLLKALKVFEGSIETKAVPYILTKFRNLYSQSSSFDGITSSDVLNGRLPNHFFELDHFLQSHCISQNSCLDDKKLIKLLYDLSWWINELHGSDHGGHNDKWSQEPKTWSIFHGALNPTNIRICTSNNCTYLIVVNFATASDLLNQQTVNNPCYNEDSKLSFHGNYLPPEMITNPEKSEKRCVLSADIYAFACIAWKLLHASVDPARALEDPFDFELKKLKSRVPNCSELSESQRLKLLFEDRSLRPSLSFARPEHDKIADLINDCWVEQPALRLTAAQLFHRVNELSRCSSSV